MTQMTRFARLLADGTVAEILTLPEGDLAETFHPDIVAALTPAPEEVAEGWRHDAGAWSAPQPDLAAMGDAARARRDMLLSACDWTQLADAPLSPEAKAAWASYRTALRELPSELGFPSAVIWPDPPAG